MKPIGNLPIRDHIRDRDQTKNEWKSLIKHYEEFDQKARLVEKYAERAVKERMKKDLEEQMRQKREREMHENLM